MKNTIIIVLFVLLTVGSGEAQTLRKAVFLCHSVGAYIWGPNGSSTSVPSQISAYNAGHGYTAGNAVTMNESLWPVTPWINDWERWHRIFENQDTVDADIRPFMRDYGTIVIKAGFVASSIVAIGDPSDTLQPTKKSIFNYKWHWKSFLGIMGQHPGNFFVVWLNAPLIAASTNDQEALLADQFCRWAKDTLTQGKDNVFGASPKNVYVFDYFHKVAGPDGKLQPQYAVSDTDSHPNAAATALVAPQFVREVFDAAIAYEEKVTPPPAPMLVSPVPGLVVNADTVRIVWQHPGHGVTRYWYEQGGDSLFSNRTVDSTITDTLFTVRSLLNGRNYWWRVKAGNGAGWGSYSEPRVFSVLITSVRGEGNPPREFRLWQNYPNPFNPSTTICYELARASHVTLTVYDMLGREAATLLKGVEEPGYKSVEFNSGNLASGMYFYRLNAGDFVQTKKFLFVK